MFLCYLGSSGKAYLFKDVRNIIVSQIEIKDMTTGKHIVRDVFCKLCKSRLGWTYEMAIPEKQRYKEGQYILEQNFIERRRGIGNKEKPKERSTSSSPSETSTFNPMRFDTAQFAIATARHNMALAYTNEPFADFNRLLNRAVAYSYTNEAAQRRNNARLRRAHLPS
jgi:hypothetical protein